MWNILVVRYASSIGMIMIKTVFSIDIASPVGCNGGLVSTDETNWQTQTNPPIYLLFIMICAKDG